MSNSKTLLIDCDGVLTDGKLYIDRSGKKMFKAFHSRDVRAIRELVANGFAVHIVTADGWEGSRSFAAKTGCEILVARDKSNLPFTNYIAIGDDAWDVRMLQQAIQCFAPADCDTSVKAIENITLLNAKGGDGVIAELVNLILE